MSRSAVTIGIDYGTLSGRVLVLDVGSGEELAAAEVPYAHGAIEDRLPDGGQSLEHDWALQHPGDYLDVINRGIPEALARAEVDPARVIGLGLDVTSCTVLPVTGDGTPLCTLERWRERPHAWPKLWKHHAAQAHADRLTALAQERGEPFLQRYGGRISSEWYFPKLLQLYEEDPEVYGATDKFIEATDWIVWQLTGTERRSSCPASYKAFWSPDAGLQVSAEYLEAAARGFSSAAARLGDDFSPVGTCAGTVRPELAQRLGLPADVAVAVGNVDSFVSVPGVGVQREGTLVTVVGTSICDMIVHPREVLLPGITGVVRDGILPGLYGYEAGQPAVGDMLAWFAGTLLGVSGDELSTRLDELERAAAALAPGQTGLVVLNWWNGNRSILADAGLSGVIAGLTLSSTPVEIYRALLESIALSARRIIDNFDEHGLTIDRVLACGGIAEKSPLTMQLLADICGRPVEVPASQQIPARGAAMFGAVAAGAGGLHSDGFSSITQAAAQLRPGTARSYSPEAASAATYDRVYDIHRGLHDALGREHADWLHDLKALRRGSHRDS